MATEDKFPTLHDLSVRLAMLVEEGLGDLPVQILVVPDSTLQAIANAAQPERKSDKPATMIEFGSEGGRMGVSIITTDRMQARGMTQH